jgi:hypothetical protein
MLDYCNLHAMNFFTYKIKFINDTAKVEYNL